jgi:hypothetical protein
MRVNHQFLPLTLRSRRAGASQRFEFRRHHVRNHGDHGKGGRGTGAGAAGGRRARAGGSTRQCQRSGLDCSRLRGRSGRHGGSRTTGESVHRHGWGLHPAAIRIRSGTRLPGGAPGHRCSGSGAQSRATEESPLPVDDWCGCAARQSSAAAYNDGNGNGRA